MCGLVCIVSPEGDLASQELEPALRALHHRGPDGTGSWISSCRRVAMGHTRLAVMDPDGGAQPMHGSDGRLHLVANGEFYGHEVIRASLRRDGHGFSSRSDSEIALHLWARDGAGALPELRGEFAFAIWDQARGELIAARDRFGIKPLFYARHAGRVLLASEVGALFEAGVPRRWDRGALAEHLVLCHPPDGTLFDGVRQVPPGCWLWTDGRDIRIRRYWDLDWPTEDELTKDVDRSGHLAAVRDAVVDAVDVRLRADVPVAHHLSGGLDSGAIVALAARHGAPRTFAVRFDDPHFDEGAAAEATARAVGARHSEVLVDAGSSAGRMGDIVAKGQMIPENAHGIARLLQSEAIRAAGFRVVLAGEGGDEMFAGYPQTQRDLRLSTVPGDVVRDDTVRRRLAASPAGRPLLDIADRMGFLPGFVLDRYLGVGAPIQGLLAPDFAAEVLAAQPCRDMFADPHVQSQLYGRSPFHRGSYLFAKTWLANYLLAAERLDMSCGLEVRLPFLDHRLHDVVRRTPLAWFSGGVDSKPLLRAALRNDLPAVLQAGTKRPFLAPPAVSDDATLSRIREVVDGGALDDLGFFRPRQVRDLLEDVRALPPGRRAGHERVVQVLMGIVGLTDQFALTG
ncbi:asparagine synthase (glutamine-hydrolyzing) [Modestobacter sp. I12A-02628]|uniref:asparagine synthase (glutamine-hydrolyzing) n=1 Tax=Goekera deserti TaxID=2497753 RepID=A0A7K3WEL1_9ACTN|nr:asparagine synthase (glutamine-hydrolyzing) [Goekera deserti]MPQ96907.1 asparagine synthase (glutamine-hydrolyzing) [Goekera deserti]NDI46780.1 asparagine synthase (glutamine-hydrolyzing) [Goekera deserti]NEL54349.1 asparagine synthase (glutamine-hydrolyzing) [Goekera deserti]